MTCNNILRIVKLFFFWSTAEKMRFLKKLVEKKDLRIVYKVYTKHYLTI